MADMQAEVDDLIGQKGLKAQRDHQEQPRRPESMLELAEPIDLSK